MIIADLGIRRSFDCKILIVFNMKVAKAFTLIELVIVMALVSALALFAAFVINPSGRVSGAADARRQNEITQMAKAFSIAKIESLGDYPLLNDSSEPTPVVLQDLVNDTACSGYGANEFSNSLNSYYNGNFTDPSGILYLVQRVEDDASFLCTVLSTGERFYRIE